MSCGCSGAIETHVVLTLERDRSAPGRRHDVCMVIGEDAARREARRTAAAMCATCIHAVRTARTQPNGSTMEGVTHCGAGQDWQPWGSLTACPMGTWDLQTPRYVRWLGIRWIGVPYPKRVALGILKGRRAAQSLRGCGCVALLKLQSKRLQRTVRPRRHAPTP